jgi:hypothetical protein
MIDACVLPVSIKGVVGSGVGNGVSAGTNLVHIQSIAISTDFSREDVLELGNKNPYYRPAGFPVEVTCDIEAISTSGHLLMLTMLVTQLCLQQLPLVITLRKRISSSSCELE